MVNTKLKTWMPWIIVGCIVLLLILIIVGSYNGLVSKQVTVDEKWANVQSAYQRRADLVPNLVATVKGASEFEEKVFTEITKARASVGKAVTPQQLQQAGTSLDSAISRLLVTVENYPQLKATLTYQDLMIQLEGSENRIKVDRDEFNKAVKEYNVKVRKFPSNIMANLFEFELREMFESDQGANKVPIVDLA